MNTSAVALSAYDIVVAQVEAAVGSSLHDLADELRASVPHVADYLNPADLMLAAGALLQNRAAIKSSFLAKGFGERLVQDWDTIKIGVKRTIAFLEQERVFDGKRLPTDVVLAPLAALWGIAPKGLDAEGEARMLLRKYLWRAFFTDRYERTSATRALTDFRELKGVLLEQSTATPTIFREDEHPLPVAEQYLGAGWPVRPDRLPRALLALSLRVGGLDLADGSAATRENLAEREYHHLFPAARLRELELSDTNINRALNCALVTWRTNRNIAAKTPEKYLAERTEGTSLGQEEVRRRLETHLVPFDELATASYDDFLNARAAKMHAVMVKLCAGQSL